MRKGPYWRERLEKGLLIHSDRGSQYASDDYQSLVKSFNMIQSMSRRGDCWDNAPMESFFDSLKTELVDNHIFEDIQEAKTRVFERISTNLRINLFDALYTNTQLKAITTERL